MPFENCPFLAYPDTPHPVLPIKISNPKTGAHLKTYGLIDTGADECVIPAWIAEELGHKLNRGKKRESFSASGPCTAYSHTTTIEVFKRDGDRRAKYRLEKIPIDYMPDCHVVLLGVRRFLDNFILTINYPRFIFSIKEPEIDIRGI